MAIAVVGAGGLTGRLCVERLLEVGYSVRAVVRSPEKYRDAFPASPSLEIVRGDVTDPKTLGVALGQAKGIIYAAAASTYFSAKAVDCEGVKKVADVAKQIGAHLVLVSTALATPKNRWNPATILLNTVVRYNCVNEKYAGENALKESGTIYTVIRPSGLTNGPRDQAELLTDQHPRNFTYVRSVVQQSQQLQKLQEDLQRVH